MNLDIDLQFGNNVEVDNIYVPTIEKLSQWVKKTLHDEKRFIQGLITRPEDNTNIELCIRVVGAEEIKQLNSDYRQKNKATNILSFESDVPPFVQDIHLLGDLVVCHEVLMREANEENIEIEDHWAHIIVHGILHLLTYDHENDEEADIMEGLEVNILNSMSYPNPYTDSEH